MKMIKSAKQVIECMSCDTLQDKLEEKEEAFQVERSEYLETIQKLNEEIQRMKPTQVINLSTPIVAGKDRPCSSEPWGCSEPVKKKREKEALLRAYTMPSFQLLDITPKVPQEDVLQEQMKVDEDSGVDVENKEGNEKRDKTRKSSRTGMKIPSWFLAEKEKEKLLKINDVTKEETSAYYWINKDTFLTKDDFIRVFNGSFITDKLIDAWGYLLCKKEKKIKIFPAHLWPLFMSHKNTTELAVRRGLTEMAEKAAKYGFFPISIPGKGANLATRNSNGNHWVLLVYDMEDNIWNYYNSMKPRTVGHSDMHMEEAMKFADFVHNILKAQTEEANCWGADYSEEGDINFNRVWESPQQAKDTVDCGFVVMMIIEALAKKGDVMKEISEAEMIQFKTNVICQLVNSHEFIELDDPDKELDNMVKKAVEYADVGSKQPETLDDAHKIAEKFVNYFPPMK